MKHFDPEEILAPEIFELLGPAGIKIYAPIVLAQLDNVREAWKRPLIINNWHKGGSFKYSGLRPLNCLIGARLSTHKPDKAKGFDIKPHDQSLHKTLWNFLAISTDLGIERIEAIEATPTWVHIELGALKGKKPRIFKP